MAEAPATSQSHPPPVGGWNTRDAWADMPVQDAITLDNLFPGTDSVRVRSGYVAHASGLNAPVETLMEYVPEDGNAVLFGCAGGVIYDVTQPGAVGNPAVSGLTNDRWQHVNVVNAGGAFLIAMNGQDMPRLYDGATWGTATITGLTASALVWCNTHQRRVWCGEQSSMTAYYLGVDAVSGQAQPFYLGGVAKRGGYLMGMATWTRDGGSGTDDVAVFMTSEGEVIVYAGTDPANANTWSLVGVFQIGRPVGRRFYTKLGADLVLITEDGFVRGTQILQADRAETDAIAMSAKINSAVNGAVRLHKGNFGWAPLLYPLGTMLLVNIPISGTQAHQYVFNTITGSACRFTGIPALSWSLCGDAPFFGDASGSVFRFDTGGSDDGSAIEWDGVQAFSSFRTRGRDKAYKRLEVVIRSGSDPESAVEVNTDYQLSTSVPMPVQQATGATGAAVWDESLWDVGLWGDDNQIWRGWRSVTGRGRSASVRVRGATTSGAPEWLATNWRYTLGGSL